MALHIITHDQDPLLSHVAQDPVRPHIPVGQRVQPGAFVAMLLDPDVRAVVCVSLTDHVPQDEQDLFGGSPDVAVFYTIWSYHSGAGRALLGQVQAEIQQRWPQVQRFVTLSPLTETARAFHLRNGAVELRRNARTVNFEYPCQGSLDQ